MERNIQAVVFDMDGILFDSERITRIMWAQAAKEYGISDVETSVRDCTGSSRPDQWAYLKKKYGSDFPAVEFRERCSTLFHEYVDKHGLPLLPYAKETLSYLANKGYLLALASSTKRVTVIKELSDAGLLGYFKSIVCGDDVTHSKPDPEIYRLSCKKLGVLPEVSLAVEDSPNGIRAAFAAGMKVVMVPDQIAPTKDIEELLFKLCKSLDELRVFL